MALSETYRHPHHGPHVSHVFFLHLCPEHCLKGVIAGRFLSKRIRKCEHQNACARRNLSLHLTQCSPFGWPGLITVLPQCHRQSQRAACPEAMKVRAQAGWSTQAPSFSRHSTHYHHHHGPKACPNGHPLASASFLMGVLDFSHQMHLYRPI